MRRFLQVLTLGAAALLFTTAGPGIAAADQGRGGKFENAPLDKPMYKAQKGHRKYGQDRRHGKRRVGEKRRRHHAREHRRNHRHARHARKHRHYGHRRRHYGHRHRHAVWPFIGLHFYRSYGPATQPSDNLGPPPAYPVQPANTEQKVADAGQHSTCLMTREYQTEILVGGELVPAYGQACLQPDGSWYRGPAVPESY
jgi:hypothetical protein